MIDVTRPLRGVELALSRTRLFRPRVGQARRSKTSRQPALEALESRELLSTTQTFDGTGTTYTLQQIGGPPDANILSGGPTGNYLNLATQPTTPVAGNNNSISFARSDAGSYDQITADWDFRVTPGAADLTGLGMSFALLNTARYGTSGQSQTVLASQALYNGSLGFGFDTAADTVYLSYNAAIVNASSLTGQLHLASDQFIHAHAEISFVARTITLVLTPSVSGSPVTVFDKTEVVNLSAYESRVAYQATSSGINFANFDLDNVNVQYAGLRQAGTVSFGATSYTVLENEGVAIIDIVRTGGTAGSVTVGFVSADGTGRNGVNYTSVAGPVTFADGETTRSLIVPILDDQTVGGNKTVKLFLSNPSLEAPLTRPITATLTIVDNDTPPPTVATRVQLVYAGRSRRVAGFRLTFSQPMDAISAQDTGNYQVTMAAKRGSGRNVAISSAVLDPSGLSVTLYRADQGRIHLTKLVQILVRGKPLTGLQDTNGVFLAGTNGVAGTDAVLWLRS